MTTNTTEQLHQQIEQLIRAHLAAQRLAATAAVERAFASSVPSTPRPSTPTPIRYAGRYGAVQNAVRRPHTEPSTARR